jgi:hypothetical protein
MTELLQNCLDASTIMTPRAPRGLSSAGLPLSVVLGDCLSFDLHANTSMKGWEDTCGTASVVISPSGCYYPLKSRETLLAALSQTVYTDSSIATTIAGSAVEDQVQELQSEINCYAALQRNWDDEGAEPIAYGAVSNAIRLVHLLPSYEVDRPSIGPMADGRLSFTWEREGRELWIYVSDRGYKAHRWESRSQFKGIPNDYTEPEALWEIFEWLQR